MRGSRPTRRILRAGLGLWLLFLPVVAGAQDPKTGADPKAATIPAETVPDEQPKVKSVEPPKAADTRAAKAPAGLASIITLSNPMVWALGACSIVTLGFTLERLVALRKGRVIPKDFVQRFSERLATGKLDRDRAIELCKANDSPMARIFLHIVRYWGQPAAVIRQALDHDAAGEIIDLKRNVRVLNGTATLAPLLGLLGTVIGMIQSFDALGSKVSAAKGEALASGISLALVSTAIGLGIAIISVAAYYFLLNKVDIVVRQLDENARQVIDLVSAEALRPAHDRRTHSSEHHSRIESRSI